MITIDRTPAGLLLTPSGAAPVLITDAAIPSALGPAIVALTLGTHAAQRARTEGYAAGHADGLTAGRETAEREWAGRVRRAENGAAA
jgi:hypothetical protein